MLKLILPSWVKGSDRHVLADYIAGTKPSFLLEKHQLSHAKLAELRRTHGIPSQAALRQQGLLDPAPSGRKAATAIAAQRGIFGPKRSTLEEIKQNREARLEKALAEHIADGTGVVLLAKKYHVSTRELSDALRSKGLEIKRGRKPGPAPPKELSDRDKAIVELVIGQGKTLESVAKMQRPLITRERVRQIVNKAGHTVGRRRHQQIA